MHFAGANRGHFPADGALPGGHLEVRGKIVITQSSMVFCENLKKEELKMHNLRYILRISSQFDLKPI